MESCELGVEEWHLSAVRRAVTLLCNFEEPKEFLENLKVKSELQTNIFDMSQRGAQIITFVVGGSGGGGVCDRSGSCRVEDTLPQFESWVLSLRVL